MCRQSHVHRFLLCSLFLIVLCLTPSPHPFENSCNFLVPSLLLYSLPVLTCIQSIPSFFIFFFSFSILFLSSFISSVSWFSFSFTVCSLTFFHSLYLSPSFILKLYPDLDFLLISFFFLLIVVRSASLLSALLQLGHPSISISLLLLQHKYPLQYFLFLRSPYFHCYFPHDSLPIFPFSLFFSSRKLLIPQVNPCLATGTIYFFPSVFSTLSYFYLFLISFLCLYCSYFSPYFHLLLFVYHINLFHFLSPPLPFFSSVELSHFISSFSFFLLSCTTSHFTFFLCLLISFPLTICLFFISLPLISLSHLLPTLSSPFLIPLHLYFFLIQLSSPPFPSSPLAFLPLPLLYCPLPSSLPLPVSFPFTFLSPRSPSLRLTLVHS